MIEHGLSSVKVHALETFASSTGHFTTVALMGRKRNSPVDSSCTTIAVTRIFNMPIYRAKHDCLENCKLISLLARHCAPQSRKEFRYNTSQKYEKNPAENCSQMLLRSDLGTARGYNKHGAT